MSVPTHARFKAIGQPSGTSPAVGSFMHLHHTDEVPVASALYPLVNANQRGGFVIITGHDTKLLNLTMQGNSVEERIFDALVALKVSVAQVAMHIPRDVRDRLFGQLDELLSLENWHSEDELPSRRSFMDFLKWTVFARHYNWSSIGLSDEGEMLCGFVTDKAIMTANFLGGGEVRWTAKVQSQSGTERAAGKCSLRYFAKQLEFYLEEE